MNKYLIEGWDLSYKNGFTSPTDLVSVEVDGINESDALTKARNLIVKSYYRLKSVQQI